MELSKQLILVFVNTQLKEVIWPKPLLDLQFIWLLRFQEEKNIHLQLISGLLESCSMSFFTDTVLLKKGVCKGYYQRYLEKDSLDLLWLLTESQLQLKILLERCLQSILIKELLGRTYSHILISMIKQSKLIQLLKKSQE